MLIIEKNIFMAPFTIYIVSKQLHRKFFFKFFKCKAVFNQKKKNLTMQSDLNKIEKLKHFN